MTQRKKKRTNNNQNSNSRPIQQPIPCSPENRCVVCDGMLPRCHTKGKEAWCDFIHLDEIDDFTPPGYEWIGTSPDERHQVFQPIALAKAREKRINSDPAEEKPPIATEEAPRLVREYELVKSELGDRIRLNAFTQEIEIDGQAIQLDKIKLDLAIDYSLHLKSSREDVQDIICKIAEANRYSPIVEYLDRCYEAHGNDTSILEGLADRYFGQTEVIYNAFAVRTLIGAVARAYQPGCKMDNALILQGKQGYLKSSWFKHLCGEEWFDDSLGAIGDKDERLKLHRSWFVEWAELETVFSRKDVAATKAFLSCGTDHVRPPYARSIQSMKRHSIIVGTTNKDEFLSDPTGNRRFWIIPCTKRIPIDLLKEERDRIWGAVVALFKQGQPWYLTPEEEEIAGAIAEEFQTRDPWEEWISEFVLDRSIASIKEILSDLLKIEPGRQEKSQQMRTADCLRRLGWKRRFEMYKGKRQWVWVQSDLPPDLPDPPRSTSNLKVDHPSNSGSESDRANSDPPDPPLAQHLSKTDSPTPQLTFTQFPQIGRSGGSGGSEVERVRITERSTFDPPLPNLQKVDREVDQVSVSNGHEALEVLPPELEGEDLWKQ